MDEVQKAKDLIVDDHNFRNPEIPMVNEHLELLHFYRVGDSWVSLFSAKNHRNFFYELTYDEKEKTAVIDMFARTQTSIIHDE
jgi:hypothetical protein